MIYIAYEKISIKTNHESIDDLDSWLREETCERRMHLLENDVDGKYRNELFEFDNQSTIKNTMKI